VYSNHDKTVTMKLKGWKFSDGQTVNAQSVMFFLNMYKALPADFWGYNRLRHPGPGLEHHQQGMKVTINFKTREPVVDH